MVFPTLRMRRLRRTSKLRQLVRETVLTPSDLVYPLFVEEGLEKARPIESMPGQFQLPLNRVAEEAEEVASLGIPALILFGIPKTKDDWGSSAYSPQGIVQQAIGEIKRAMGDRLVVVTDVCLCQYTSHGHCGILQGQEMVNDATLEVLEKVALSHARAGADVVAPSAMVDGQVQAIRKALDREGFENVAIMAYSAKQASSFYGPFREAAYSAPAFGDRRSYQMDYANSDEALREVELDVKEGADIVMVKPALPCLDLIHRVKTAFRMPTAAYSVSGEYSMIKAAAARGWVHEKAAVLEVLTAIKRAGADIILTYHAKEAAGWLKE
nr:porphobilinogen synthase [Candidatus Hecatella orcuttiae]